VRQVAKEGAGEFMYAGLLMVRPSDQTTVPVEFHTRDDHMRKAFELAGQGKFSEDDLDDIAGHNSVAYLFFSPSILEQRETLIAFSEFMQKMGGIAVKVESTGTAHTWENWLELLRSDSPKDWYTSLIVLIGGEEVYYSCGMHHFGMADVEVPRSLDIQEAAYLMNNFNVWRIVEKKKIETGQTFSVDEDAPRFRMSQVPDSRHEEDDLFHNPEGLWRLDPVEA